MLKKDLEKLIDDKNVKIDELRDSLLSKNVNLRDKEKQLEKKDNEIKHLSEQVEFFNDRMKQLSQSIHTMLQVKYPDTYAPEPVDEGEDKRFLMFLHELCIDKNHHVTSARELFNYLGR